MSSRHYNSDPHWKGRSYKKGGQRISVLRERVLARREQDALRPRGKLGARVHDVLDIFEDGPRRPSEQDATVAPGVQPGAVLMEPETKASCDITGSDLEAMGFKTVDQSRFREETYTECTKGDLVVSLTGPYVYITLLFGPEKPGFTRLHKWNARFSSPTPARIVMAVIKEALKEAKAQASGDGA